MMQAMFGKAVPAQTSTRANPASMRLSSGAGVLPSHLSHSFCSLGTSAGTSSCLVAHQQRHLSARTHRRSDLRHRRQALAAGGDAQHNASVDFAKVQSFAWAFYKFTRPHTMAGTTISILSISALAFQQLGGAWSIAALASALTSALLMNITIVGINQLADIEIDKVNKPDLPLASGEFTPSTGLAIVVGCAVASLMIGQVAGTPPLMATLLVSLGLGIVYSVELPFLRWKRSPLLAAGCILVVRALAVQLGFYAHAAQAVMAERGLGAVAGGLGAPLPLTPPVLFTVTFMLLFSVVIALFKDIPDAKGDSVAGVRTMTVRLGPHSVFWACIWILTAAYAGAVVYCLGAAAVQLLPGLFSSPSGVLDAGSSMAHAVASAAHAPHLSPASMSLSSSSATGAGVLGLFGPGSSAAVGLVARTALCIAGHVGAAVALWRRAVQVDLSRRSEITSAYMYVWKLFYLEYLLIPLLP